MRSTLFALCLAFGLGCLCVDAATRPDNSIDDIGEDILSMIAAEPDAAPHATGTITQAPSLDAAEKTGKSFLPLAWRSRGKLPVHSSY
jgi:hypothetical protein